MAITPKLDSIRFFDPAREDYFDTEKKAVVPYTVRRAIAVFSCPNKYAGEDITTRISLVLDVTDKEGEAVSLAWETLRNWLASAAESAGGQPVAS